MQRSVAKAPPLLLAAVLLFWGWQTGFLTIGALLAVAVESTHIIKVRWEFSTRDFHRIWDFCTGIFLVLVAYTFTANEGPGAIKDIFQGMLAVQSNAALKTARAALLMLQWLPMILFPLVAAQLYSTGDSVPLSTFSLWLRRQRKGQKAPPPERGLNVVYPFFGIALGSASITVRDDLAFYGGFCLLMGWALWFYRSPRFSLLPWAAAIAAAVALGYVGQVQLQRLRQYVETFNPEWLLAWRKTSLDLQEGKTAIGRLGRIKLSNRIVLRVKPNNHHAVPTLLREASYRKFTSPIWRGIVSRDEYGSLISESDQTTWMLRPDQNPAQSVNIGGYLDDGRGILALPSGTARLQNLAVFTLRTNRLGVVLVDSGPGLVVFDALFGPGLGIDAPPDKDDLDISEKEAWAVAEVAAELNLTNPAPAQVLAAVKSFFRDRFRYTMDLEIKPVQGSNSPVSQFLRETREGHCEYFATAAALLLRQFGIPARYAIGYVVEERSGSSYVVRERHAHAWTLVYHDGQWQDFDATPANGERVELAEASLFQGLSDALSRIWYEFNKWRWGQTSLRKYVLWVLGPVLVILLAQLFLRKEWRRFRQARQDKNTRPPWPGLDSEYYAVSQRLASLGLERSPQESIQAWCRRLQQDGPAALRPQLVPLVALHQRYRFDSAGLTRSEREELRRQAQACLRVLENGSSFHARQQVG